MRYQIVKLNEDGRWSFIAHGARYVPHEAMAMITSMTGRGLSVMLLPCPS